MRPNKPQAVQEGGANTLYTKDLQSDKFMRQESQYVYPYHYIPHFDQEGYGRRSRMLTWGYDYLCYMKHTAELVRKLRPESVLDVGCGMGRFLGLLNGSIPTRVGVDLSRRAIEFAKLFDTNSAYYCIDPAELDTTFDVVVAIQVLEHVPEADVAKFINTLSDKARSNGSVIVVVPTTNIKLNPKHYRHYNIDVFRKELNESDAPLRIDGVDYLCKTNVFYKTFMRLSYRWGWLFELSPIRKRVWEYYWRRLRLASEKDGANMLVRMKKEV